MKYLNMIFTGMFSVETVLKIIGFGARVSAEPARPAVDGAHSFVVAFFFRISSKMRGTCSI